MNDLKKEERPVRPKSKIPGLREIALAAINPGRTALVERMEALDVFGKEHGLSRKDVTLALALRKEIIDAMSTVGTDGKRRINYGAFTPEETWERIDDRIAEFVGVLPEVVSAAAESSRRPRLVEQD